MRKLNPSTIIDETENTLSLRQITLKWGKERLRNTLAQKKKVVVLLLNRICVTYYKIFQIMTLTSSNDYFPL